MPRKKRKLSNTKRSLEPTPDQTNEDEDAPMAVSARNSFKSTDDMRVMLQFDVDSPLTKVCREHEIRLKMAKYLPRLSKYKIVFLCDDSGSMNSPVAGPTDGTRWNELCRILKIGIEIGLIFNPEGIDIYFLNRQPLLGVTDLTIVDRAFQTSPSGYTPLVSNLDDIFKSNLPRLRHNQKLLVIIATDGEPTDDDGNSNVPELERLMLNRHPPDTIYISFLVCTNDQHSVAYLRRWDKDMENVDVTSNFDTERSLIRRRKRQQNYSFSFGDYIVKVMVGAIVPEIGCLNK